MVKTEKKIKFKNTGYWEQMYISDRKTTAVYYIKHYSAQSTGSTFPTKGGVESGP